MKLMIYPSILKGLVEAPQSKSLTHRALICASFANGKSKIIKPLLSDDIIATVNCLKKLGAEIDYYENSIVVQGKSSYCYSSRSFDANESATTLRLLLPLLSIFNDELKINGTPRLIERVWTDDLLALKNLGISKGNSFIKVTNSLDELEYNLSGAITSQHISGMIFALPFLKNNPTLFLHDIEVSDPYLQMTYEVATAFGLKFDIDEKANSIKLKQNCGYQAHDMIIEGDYSNGAVWLAASYLNPDVRVGELRLDSIQGDIAFLDYLRAMHVEYNYLNGEYQYRSGKICSTLIDIIKTPDLGPILVALASLGKETITITGIEKLSYKESNRIMSISDGINRLGGKVEVHDDKMIIHGQEFFAGGCELESYNDHRIIMALTIISSRCKKPYIINDFLGINKSYPKFFEDYQKLGGKVEVI